MNYFTLTEAFYFYLKDANSSRNNNSFDGLISTKKAFLYV